MPVRILFVDDDVNVLNGLRRMLYSMKSDWTMSFVGSGAEALALMAREPQDVVVSDMRMPEMDGAELLTEVRRRFPQTVRVILSGHCDHDMILKSIGPTHQYLTKPCDPRTLRGIIRQAIALNDLLRCDRIRTVALRMDSLPSMPGLLTALLAELQKPGCSLQSVGEIISADVGMTSQVLRLVNSSFFGLRREISDPATAVTFLGLNTVTALVMTHHIFKGADESALSWLGLDTLWQHCLSSGQMARNIVRAENQDRKMGDEAFAAGLIHGAGVLILAVNFPEQYRSVVERARREKVPVSEVEREQLEVTHAEVGAYLMGIWGIPHPIIEALAYNCAPSASLGREFSPLAALHVACRFDHAQRPAEVSLPVTPLDLPYLQESGLEGKLEHWHQICRETFSQPEDVREGTNSLCR